MTSIKPDIFPACFVLHPSRLVQLPACMARPPAAQRLPLLVARTRRNGAWLDVHDCQGAEHAAFAGHQWRARVEPGAKRGGGRERQSPSLMQHPTLYGMHMLIVACDERCRVTGLAARLLIEAKASKPPPEV